MSDINNEIIDYLKLEKQVRLDGLEMMDKSAEIPQRLLKEVSVFDRWIEHLANGLPTSDSGLHLQRVRNNEERVAAADNDNGWITPTKEDIAAQHENYDPC